MRLTLRVRGPHKPRGKVGQAGEMLKGRSIVHVIRNRHVGYLPEQITHLIACSKMGHIGFQTNFSLIFTLIHHEQNKSSYSTSIAGRICWPQTFYCCIAQ